MVTKTQLQVTEAVAATVSTVLAEQGHSTKSAAEKTGIPRATLTRRLLGYSDFKMDELTRIGNLVGMPVSVIVARAEGRTERNAS